MKVFLSWSGQRSKAVAEVFKKLMPCILPDVTPFFSPDDIEKGGRWSPTIAQNLADSNFGIIILTSDNLNKPWLMFEAGALSKSMDDSRVCPFLFDITPAEIGGPLTQFQALQNNEAEIKKLFSDINNQCVNKTPEDRFELLFSKFYPDLQKSLCKVQTASPEKQKQKVNIDSAIIELLELTREIRNTLSRERVADTPPKMTPTLGSTIRDEECLQALLNAAKQTETSKNRDLKAVLDITTQYPNLIDRLNLDVNEAFKDVGEKLRKHIEDISKQYTIRFAQIKPPQTASHPESPPSSPASDPDNSGSQ